MEREWPGRGAWMITATAAEIDWQVAVAAIAAAADVPVALVVVGAAVTGDSPARPHLAGLLELTDEVALHQARDLVAAMARAHELVLVAAPAGLLVPLGPDGWNLAELAAAVGAPAVVVTGPGPDAVNHTTLALGALSGHGVAAAVVTIGEVDEAALPVTPAGRIPTGHAGDFAPAAEWLEPMLRPSAAPEAPPPVPEKDDSATVSGKRLVLGLGAVFVVMVLVVCGLALWGQPGQVEHRISISSRQGSGVTVPVPVPAVSLARRPSAADACPPSRQRVAPARPGAAVTARVNAAWQRIEKWLTAHAPASAGALRPPAPPERIDELQQQMSVAFPPDLVASLRRHDGVGSGFRFVLPHSYEPSSVDGIRTDWQTNCEVLANVDPTTPADWWDRAYVPFAADGAGGSLVLDQRPGGHGRVGDFYPESGTSFERWPASLAEMLELTARSLETGRPYAGRYFPKVDGSGVLSWATK